MHSILKYMPRVQDYLRRLGVLQNTWGNLSLLSQMTGGGTDLVATRAAFEELSQELVSHLAAETQRKAITTLAARAQVAIDVLVRNLFERTADIGFLAIDDDIVAFMRQWTADGAGEVEPGTAALLRERFREYAAKYSVYSNVVLLAPDGRVLVQLDERNPTTWSADALVGRTLASSAPFVESFGATDLAGGRERTLVYSYRVGDQRHTLGVLALVFRFEDEMRAIFDKLRAGPDDWTALVLMDGRQVIASSDLWQLPIGAPLGAAAAAEGEVVRFAGREYLAVSRATAGYQGYMGPAGWTAQALLPLEHAFEERAGGTLAELDAQLLDAAHRGAAIFSAELRAIPRRADRIERDLNRSVWNGNLRPAGTGSGDAFAGALLREISATGRSTRELFARSIGDLQETVLSSLLQDGAFRASLAADILDRNLYERANDCRWWALNGTLRACLEGRAGADAATGILRQINELYTVYDHILLFDRDCRVVATSKPARAAATGTRLAQQWAGTTLQLRDSQSWSVSRFEPLDAYDGRSTWVFTAAVRGSDGVVRGGIALVFDAAPQVEAMLRDVLPQGAGAPEGAGGTALFVDAEARVLAATAGYLPGDMLALPARLLNAEGAGAVDILQLADGYYAVGARRCHGYREFPGLAVTAIALRRLGDLAAGAAAPLPHRQLGARTQSGKATHRVATFASAGQWLAVPAGQVAEAVDAEGVTRMPGASDWYTGVVRFGGALLPVIDLARWYGVAGNADASTIVVVEDGEARVGLLVDQLGEVVEVGAEDIVDVPVQARGQPGAARAGRARAVKFGDVQDVTLPVIDVGSLMSVLGQ
jgi:chemotaxis signal transduction protein